MFELGDPAGAGASGEGCCCCWCAPDGDGGDPGCCCGWWLWRLHRVRRSHWLPCLLRCVPRPPCLSTRKKGIIAAALVRTINQPSGSGRASRHRSYGCRRRHRPAPLPMGRFCARHLVVLIPIRVARGRERGIEIGGAGECSSRPSPHALSLCVGVVVPASVYAGVCLFCLSVSSLFVLFPKDQNGNFFFSLLDKKIAHLSILGGMPADPRAKLPPVAG